VLPVLPLLLLMLWQQQVFLLVLASCFEAFLG
jgi:hypothetical protein